MTLDRTAVTDAPIIDVLAERWSTRVFGADIPLDEAALRSALEAARWAPSARNIQPTRFIVARRGSDAHSKVLAALAASNRTWADAASALVVVIAETHAEDGAEYRWAVYDSGQAAAFFTVQAHAEGLHTHQMGGFDADAVREAFTLPERLRPQTVIAVGALGDVSIAPEGIRERENAPRVRRRVGDSVLVDD